MLACPFDQLAEVGPLLVGRLGGIAGVEVDLLARASSSSAANRPPSTCFRSNHAVVQSSSRPTVQVVSRSLVPVMTAHYSEEFTTSAITPSIIAPKPRAGVGKAVSLGKSGSEFRSISKRAIAFRAGRNERGDGG